MVEKIKKTNKDYKDYCNNGPALIQSIIRGANVARFAVCWPGGKPPTPFLMSVDKFLNTNLNPIYIKALQGHSGVEMIQDKVDTNWEVYIQHTPFLYHSGFRHNLDSILRNGLLAGVRSPQD